MALGFDPETPILLLKQSYAFAIWPFMIFPPYLWKTEGVRQLFAKGKNRSLLEKTTMPHSRKIEQCIIVSISLVLLIC